jgi:hypothetical protein
MMDHNTGRSMTLTTRTIALAVGVLFALGVLAASLPRVAEAHRSGCHRSHSCPSDHATYRWRQPSTGQMLLCVAPYADERNSTFGTRVAYQGRTYWCRRSRSNGGTATCDPNYKGACLDPDASDYDCPGGSGDGPKYVQGPVTVVGDDHYRLDADGDGVGCE